MENELFLKFGYGERKPGTGLHGKGGRKKKNQHGYNIKYSPCEEVLQGLLKADIKSDYIDKALLFYQEHHT